MFFDKLNKQSVPELDSALADKILSNVLDSCGYQPNTVPLEQLSAAAAFNAKPAIAGKIAPLAIAATAAVTPVAVDAPDFTVTQVAQNTYQPVYEIEVDAMLPIENVQVNLNGKEVSSIAPETHTFHLSPDTNGEMSVTVTLINGRSVTKSIELTEVDYVAPTASINIDSGEQIVIQANDDISGIDYEAVVGIDLDTSNAIAPLSYNAADGTIIFPYSKNTLKITIPDIAGNKYHVTITTTTTTIIITPSDE